MPVNTMVHEDNDKSLYPVAIWWEMANTLAGQPVFCQDNGRTDGGAGGRENPPRFYLNRLGRGEIFGQWRFAVAPLARLALAPPWPPGSFRPGWLVSDEPESDAEAKEAQVLDARDIVTPGGTQVAAAYAPGTTAVDPERAFRRTNRVTHFNTRIIPVPIRTPLPNVSVHIEKAPRVGRVLSDVCGPA